MTTKLLNTEYIKEKQNEKEKESFISFINIKNYICSANKIEKECVCVFNMHDSIIILIHSLL